MVYLLTCLQQDVCSSYGGAGGRNRPAANSYERTKVSHHFLWWLYVISLFHVWVTLFKEQVTVTVSLSFCPHRQEQKDPHHHPQVPSRWELRGLGLRRAHHNWLNIVWSSLRWQISLSCFTATILTSFTATQTQWRSLLHARSLIQSPQFSGDCKHEVYCIRLLKDSK